MKHRIKRINYNGDITTVFSDESKSRVLNWMELVVERNTLFKTWQRITFIDGCKGWQATKDNGNIIQYKIETY